MVKYMSEFHKIIATKGGVSYECNVATVDTPQTFSEEQTFKSGIRTDTINGVNIQEIFSSSGGCRIAYICPIGLAPQPEKHIVLRLKVLTLKTSTQK